MFRVSRALNRIMNSSIEDSAEEEEDKLKDKDRRWMAESGRLARNRFMDDLSEEPEELKQVKDA